MLFRSLICFLWRLGRSFGQSGLYGTHGIGKWVIVHYDDGGWAILGFELHDFEFLAEECGKFKHRHHSSAHANSVRRVVPCLFILNSEHYSLASWYGFSRTFQTSTLTPIFSFSQGDAHVLHPFVLCYLARYGVLTDLSFYPSAAPHASPRISSSILQLVDI